MSKQVKRVLVLRTCGPKGESYNGFRWPLKVGARVTAPDWNPDKTIVCGNGLHGLLNGNGDAGLLGDVKECRAMIVSVAVGDIADMAAPEKIRFRACRIEHVSQVGKIETALAYLRKHGVNGPLPYEAVSGGNGATVSGGAWATVSGSDRATVSGGDRATVSGGNGATVSGGDGATVSGGTWATVSGGNGATVSGGTWATVSGGDGAVVSGGDGAAVSGGAWATVSGGDGAAVSGGNGATVSGGDGASLSVKYYDGARHRIAVAYVGEDGIEAGVKYRVDKAGKFVKA